MSKSVELDRIRRLYRYGIRSRTTVRSSILKIKEWLDDNYSGQFDYNFNPIWCNDDFKYKYTFGSKQLRIVIDIDLPEMFFKCSNKYGDPVQNKSIKFEATEKALKNNFVCIRMYLFDVPTDKWKINLKKHIDAISCHIPTNLFICMSSDFNCINNVYDDFKESFANNKKVTITNNTGILTLDHFFSPKKTVVVMNSSNEISKHSLNKHKGENILFVHLSKYFERMNFEREFCIKNNSHYNFDLASDIHKIIIESDGPEHFRNIKELKNSYQRTQRNDRIKNKICIERGYTIIRIEQDIVFSDVVSWKPKLQSYLHQIECGNIRNAFLWISKSNCAEKCYIYQFNKLFSIKNTMIENTKYDTQRKGRTVLYQHLITMTSSLEEIFSHLNVCRPFKPKWLKGYHTYSLGSSIGKFVIIIDHLLFENHYNNENYNPDKQKIKEIDKTIKAIKHGYTCIRIYHELLNEKKFIDKLIPIVKNIDDCKNDKKIVWFDTHNKSYNNIYKHLEENVLSELRKQR